MPLPIEVSLDADGNWDRWLLVIVAHTRTEDAPSCPAILGRRVGVGVAVRCLLDGILHVEEVQRTLTEPPFSSVDRDRVASTANGFLYPSERLPRGFWACHDCSPRLHVSKGVGQ